MTDKDDNRGTLLPIPADFPVEWENDAEVTYLWRWDSIHSPLPSSPMSISLGEDRVARQAKQNPAASNTATTSFRRRINGYSYSASLPTQATDEERQKQTNEMDEAIGTLRELWDTEIRPTMEAELGRAKSVQLRSLTDSELLEQLNDYLELSVKHWKFHNQVVGPTHSSVHRLSMLYKEIMGDVTDDEPYRLIRGLDNKSLETDLAIQELAKKVREAPETLRIFINNDEPREILSSLDRSAEGTQFLKMLDKFLDVYGLRPTGFDALYPSWKEDPSFVILNIRSFIQSSPRDIRTEQETLSEDAEQCQQMVLAKIGDDRDRIAEFQTCLEHARELWPLKEDHAFYIDQGSAACLRILLAEVGRRLSSHGVINDSDDVFYLTLDEALTALKSSTSENLGDLATERRNQRDAQIKIIPPAFLGTLPGDGSLGMAPEFRSMMGPAPEANGDQDETVLRGGGGASGSVTGPAKIVRSPEEFAKIRPGDILVCTSTSPTWTPLFGTVGALVSDSGGVLSHTAIVAREYGLPAVVGVKDGTRRIADGQIITVDGDNGLVLLR